MEQQILTNRVYRHFKGNYYYVIAIGEHSETGEDYVVYRALYGEDSPLYVRPYSMFASEVDHEKYPNVIQKFRFELVNTESIGRGE